MPSRSTKVLPSCFISMLSVYDTTLNVHSYFLLVQDMTVTVSYSSYEEHVRLYYSVLVHEFR
jgi:hypothetical protein